MQKKLHKKTKVSLKTQSGSTVSISPGHFVQTIFSYIAKINTMSQWRAYIIANKFPQIYFSFLPQ